MSKEQQRWLGIGVAIPAFLCCLCLAVVFLPAAGQKLSRDPLAAPQLAPIQLDALLGEEPGWWANYLGYATIEEMVAAHQAQGDVRALASATLWPARPGVFIVGLVRDWACQGQSCTFYLDMAGKEYAISSEQRFLSGDVQSLDGRWVRVFGDQAGERAVVVARLIDRQGRWWAWWERAWRAVYQDYDWQKEAWVYSVADRNPYSPIDAGEYATLQPGDRILLRGKWLEGGARQPMEFSLSSLYRLRAGSYVVVSGQPQPAPRPTVTLRP